MHYHEIEDLNGDLIDLEYYCSDLCHQDSQGVAYAGWNGAHEGPDYVVYCANCGVRLNVGDNDQCDATCVPLVVQHDYGTETCEHGIRLSYV
mgnify:CR=1 FL=1